METDLWIDIWIDLYIEWKDLSSNKKKLPTKENPGTDGITGKFHHTFKEESVAILDRLF